MKEEIETQRRVTRQAQSQLHALQHALDERKKEIELVKRHLSSFEAQAKLSPPPTASAGPLSSARQTSSSALTSSTISSATVAVLVAGAQAAGAGARHRESIAAAASLAESEASGASGQPVSAAARLKDHVQRQDLYKKKLKNLLDRLSRHLQFVLANLEALRLKHASAQRELAFFHDKVVQERNHCTDLEHKKHELAEQYATHAHSAALVLNSLRQEIASRSTMNRQRYEADRRREQLLTLIQSSPAAREGSSRTASTDRGAIALSTTGRSMSRKNSQFAAHETLMQVYEGQYARVLEETHESDLSVVIERFVSFRETKRRLLQVESDASEQNAQLEREREAHSELVRKLRVSGIAEVEKRKKIRDFLEQMHHAKAQMKSQAKDRFLEQLKIFSCA